MEEKKILMSVKDLEVKFRVRGRILTAIRGISLDLYENESIAIVGESGSGKSVFTKTFAGMLDSNGFISNGGSAVNIIADEVVMQYCTRGKTPEAYKNASDKVDRSFKAAAMATGCDVTIETMAGYMSGVVNENTKILQSVFDDIKAEGKTNAREEHLAQKANQ